MRAKKVWYLMLVLFLSLAVQGQGVKDSVISKTWMGGFADYLKFDTVNGQARFMFYFNPGDNTSSDIYTYSIDDSTVTLEGSYKGSACKFSLKYKYFGDSLTIKITELNEDCLHAYIASWQLDRQLILKAKPSHPHHPLEKFAMRYAGVEILVDPWGNLLVEACGRYLRGFLGTYRGTMNDTTFRKLKKLIVENKLNSRGKKGRVSDGTPIEYALFYGGKVYEGNNYGLESDRREPLMYLIKSLKQEDLKFQNYICGDSVEGLFLIETLRSYHYVSSGKLKMIGSFKTKAKYYDPRSKTSEKEKRHRRRLNIYRFQMAKVFSGQEQLNSDLIYLIADSVLNTENQSILVFQDIAGSRLSEKSGAPAAYVAIRQYGMPSDKDTVVVQGPQLGFIVENYDIKTYDQRRGIRLFGKHFHSPFKSSFERAYKKYILKDWEEFHDGN